MDNLLPKSYEIVPDAINSVIGESVSE